MDIMNIVIAFIGTVVATAITIIYIITGWGVQGLPKYSAGYVDWVLVPPIAIAGCLFVPLGVKLSNKLPKKFLQILFGFLLLAIAIKMIVSSHIF